MSGSAHIISFDLRKGQGSKIDLTRMLPLTPLHPLDHKSRGRDMLDDMAVQRKTPDLRKLITMEIVRFSTLETLDIATDEIRRVTVSTGSAVYTRTLREIDIVPPIYIPYGTLDVRKYEKYQKLTVYPDLFTRTLPYGLMARRAAKGTAHLFKKHRRHIAYTCGIFLACSLPLLYFVKSSIEHGYEELASLTHATGSLSLQEHVLAARGHFERAKVVFVPFSWIPFQTIDLAGTALNG